MPLALALLLAAGEAAGAPPLPAGSARYRVELGGHPVGVARLEVRCGGGGCEAAWSARLRAPADAGGAVHTRRIAVALDRAGRLAGPVSVEVDGERRPGAAIPGAVPASVVELALGAALRAGGGEAACLDAFDEEGGARGRACARRAGGALSLEVLGVAERLVLDADGFPREVLIAAQSVRFVRDPGAGLPAWAPPLEVRVPGPADPGAARRFCGLAPDPTPATPAVPVPAPSAPGASCREKSAAWVAAAAREGLEARTAVGVAHDGAGFVWHAWAEVRVDGRWIPVDPAFGELPAAGPRFTVARYAPGDGPGRAEAGRRILACWGRARVQ